MIRSPSPIGSAATLAVALLLVACAPLPTISASPEASGSHAAVEPSASPRRVGSRPPRRLCKPEISALDAEIAAMPVVPPQEPPVSGSRKLVFKNNLPRDYVIEALVMPTATTLQMIDRPRDGELGSVDLRGVQGSVRVVVRHELTGGLYDYIGDCETLVSYLSVPSDVVQTGDTEIVLSLSLIGARPALAVLGVYPENVPERLRTIEEHINQLKERSWR